MSFPSWIRNHLRTNGPKELADAVQVPISTVLQWANDDVSPSGEIMTNAMAWINRNNWKHSEQYCSCPKEVCEIYQTYCHTSNEPMTNRIVPSEPTIICKCGQEATWFYEPSDWGCCDICIDSHRGCSCNWHLKEGISTIWSGEEGNSEIINPEEDYAFCKDDDGKDLPCCEFSSKKWKDKEEQMVRDSVDAFARQLAKLQEEPMRSLRACLESDQQPNAPYVETVDNS